MNLDKKSLSIYKSFVKKMLICISKVGGSNKEKDDIAFIYHYINKQSNNIYPVILINQSLSPRGDNYYPAKFFIVDNTFPKDINIFNTDSNSDKYNISSSAEINISEFKKILPDIKELIIETNEKGIDIIVPGVISRTNDRNIGYVDALSKISSLSKIIKTPRDNFHKIENDAILNFIHSTVIEDTCCSININSTGNILKLFFTVVPIKMDKLEYFRLLNFKDSEVTSTVYLKQFIGDIVLHNFYRYIDIWSKLNSLLKRMK